MGDRYNEIATSKLQSNFNFNFSFIVIIIVANHFLSLD